MKFRKTRYLNLLVVVVVMMFLLPFTSRTPMLRMSGNIILTLVLLSAVYTVKKQRRTFIAGLILCIPSVVTSWMYLISPMAIHPAVHSAATMVFDGYIIYILLHHIIRAKKVTADIIYGAFSIYILLGVFFTTLYLFLDGVTTAHLFKYTGVEPGTILIEDSKIFYFSFVTLTTLGYGDIQPIADSSRTIAVIEAMVGVLYSAALIGRLIGLYVAQSDKSEAAAEAASKAAAAASAAADAAATNDLDVAVAAAKTASRAAADAAEAAESAKSDSDEDDENGDDDKDSKEPDTSR